MGPAYFWWGGMWIFPLVGIIIMLIAIYLIFGRGGFRSPCYWHDHERFQGTGKREETALDILKKRYARGEISKEEFEQIKRDL